MPNPGEFAKVFWQDNPSLLLPQLALVRALAKPLRG
jgi:hypothetical protein